MGAEQHWQPAVQQQRMERRGSTATVMQARIAARRNGLLQLEQRGCMPHANGSMAHDCGSCGTCTTCYACSGWAPRNLLPRWW